MGNDRFGRQIQALGNNSDRVLMLSDLVARKSGTGRFVPQDVVTAFYELDVPPPGNVSAVLATLRTRRKVLQHPDRQWALTPLGREALERLAVEFATVTERALEDTPRAQFAHVDHTVIPSWAAPPRWAAGISRLLERHPFESNVFCMTRFPSEGGISDPVMKAVQIARHGLADYGLTLHLDADGVVEEDLLSNVGAYIWGCRYGLGIIENRAGRGINHNAVIELGSMILTGRRCVILQDRTVDALPADLAGHIFKPVDLDDESTVRAAVMSWVSNDLGLSRRTGA